MSTRNLLQGRGGLITKLALLCLLAVSLMPLGCEQGGIVEGEVCSKMVTGMQDRRYFIIVRNEPADGAPSIVFDETVEDSIRRCFPPAGDLVVDDSTLDQIQALYTGIAYMVTIHLMSGEEYSYYQACRAERDIFNDLQMGTRVRVNTLPSDIGPLITEIVD